MEKQEEQEPCIVDPVNPEACLNEEPWQREENPDDDLAEVDFQDNQKIKFYKPREKVSDGKIREYFTPFFFNKETTGNWLRSLAVLTISGGLAVVSPFVLKVLVDGMT